LSVLLKLAVFRCGVCLALLKGPESAWAEHHLKIKDKTPSTQEPVEKPRLHYNS